MGGLELLSVDDRGITSNMSNIDIRAVKLVLPVLSAAESTKRTGNSQLSDHAWAVGINGALMTPMRTVMRDMDRAASRLAPASGNRLTCSNRRQGVPRNVKNQYFCRSTARSVGRVVC